MPRVNIYITSDNYEHWKWLTAQNLGSNFVNNALKYDVGAAVRQSKLAASNMQVISKTTGLGEAVAKTPKNKGSFCKHGYSPGFCKKGCK